MSSDAQCVLTVDMERLEWPSRKHRSPRTGVPNHLPVVLQWAGGAPTRDTALWERSGAERDGFRFLEDANLYMKLSAAVGQECTNAREARQAELLADLVPPVFGCRDMEVGCVEVNCLVLQRTEFVMGDLLVKLAQGPLTLESAAVAIRAVVTVLRKMCEAAGARELELKDWHVYNIGFKNSEAILVDFGDTMEASSMSPYKRIKGGMNTFMKYLPCHEEMHRMGEQRADWLRFYEDVQTHVLKVWWKPFQGAALPSPEALEDLHVALLQTVAPGAPPPAPAPASASGEVAGLATAQCRSPEAPAAPPDSCSRLELEGFREANSRCGSQQSTDTTRLSVLSEQHGLGRDHSDEFGEWVLL